MTICPKLSPRKDQMTSQIRCQTALVELLKTQPLEKISVTKLTQQAGLHRGTFYKHYEDIYALFDELVDQLVRDLEVIVTMPEAAGRQTFFETFLSFFEDRRELTRLIFEQSDHNPIFQAAYQTMRFHYTDYYEETVVDYPYVMTYHMDGLLGILRQWVLDDFAEERNQILAGMMALDAHFEALLLGDSPKN